MGVSRGSANALVARPSLKDQRRSSSAGKSLARWSEATKSPEERMEQIQRAFKVFDRNNDGTISEGELISILTMPLQGRTPLKPAQVKSIFALVDADSNGRVDYTEFAQAWAVNGNELGDVAKKVAAI